MLALSSPFSWKSFSFPMHFQLVVELGGSHHIRGRGHEIVVGILEDGRGGNKRI